jgi:hypothetical protein
MPLLYGQLVELNPTASDAVQFDPTLNEHAADAGRRRLRAVAVWRRQKIKQHSRGRFQMCTLVLNTTCRALSRRFAAVALAASAMSAQAVVVYDSTPAVIPANLASQPYQAQATREFGDHVQLAGSARLLTTVTMTMSNWAYQSIYLSDPRYSGANLNNAGYTQNLTANLYAVNTSGPVPAAGALLTTLTQATLIPWRAEPNAACPGIQWLSAEGCRNGMAFNVSFDFSAANITLPNDVIFSMAMNTQSYGANPIGSNGPYNSLNFALTGGTTVGADANNDAVFWNTSNGFNLSNPANAGVFAQDQGGWVGFTPAFQISAVPEPEAYALALAGMLMVSVLGMRRRKA